MIDRAIGIFGLGLSIISLVTSTVFPVVNKKIGYAGFAVGLLLMGVAAGIFFLPGGNAQSPPAVTQGPGSAYSHGQQGGITAGTIIAPSRASFTGQLGKELTTHMPMKTKTVELKSVGGVEDQKVGDDVEHFLRDDGYSVQRTSIGMLVPPPNHPFSFDETPNSYVITVAPSAH